LAGGRYFVSPSQLGPPFLGRIAVMAKPKKKKEVVFLVCEESGDRNYTLLKKPGTPKLELNKYCARLRKHTKHIEKKK
jgi:large subunit ribosomal protein L33